MQLLYLEVKIETEFSLGGVGGSDVHGLGRDAVAVGGGACLKEGEAG